MAVAILKGFISNQKFPFDNSTFAVFIRAVRRYTAAIRVDPTYIRAYICRAEAYHKLHMVGYKSHGIEISIRCDGQKKIVLGVLYHE